MVNVTINISLMVSTRCLLGRSDAMSDATRPAPDRRRYWDGVRAALPLGLADLAFGTWFGVLAHAAGMGNVAAVVMSATTFAGSAQFAAASVLGAGGAVAAAVTAAVMLNLRYGPIGLSAAPLCPARAGAPRSPPSSSSTSPGPSRSGSPAASTTTC
jgi:predicted branched-subunit amino acid permease